MDTKKDIFISYKANDEAELFAKDLSKALEALNYSVYFNPEEKRSEDFTEKIRIAVENCKDFILIVSSKCLDALKSGNENDWVRFELLTARDKGKNIIPIMLNGIAMPSNFDDMPSELQFLPKIDNIEVPSVYKFYKKSPFDQLLISIKSKCEKGQVYRDVDNSNVNYCVYKDFCKTLEEAKNGNIKAQYEIGIMYYFGFSDINNQTDSNFKEATKWFKKIVASENEYSAYAHTMLAKMYFSGAIPREGQSFEKSLENYRKAAKTDPYSKSKFDLMTLQGLGCDFNYTEIERRAEECNNTMDSRIICEIASIYVSYGKFDKAAELYEKITFKSPDVEYQKGLLHKRGVYKINDSSQPKPNYSEAERCFRNASDAGHLQATYELANIFFNPTGKCIPDFEKAKIYFKKAAEKGHTEAQYKLGWIYEYGLAEGKKDYKKAIECYENAVKNGHGLAALQLAQLYQCTNFCNYQKAFHYAKISARSGCDIAQFILGNLYFFGRGCDADMDEAYKWYKKAYDNNIFQAKFMMEKIDKIMED